MVKTVTGLFQGIHFQGIWDKIGIGLSVACTIHCLALPILAVVIPALGVTWFSDESIHRWLCLFVVIASVFAFTSGYTLHASRKPAFIAVSGIIFLLSAVFMGPIVGEFFEKFQTFMGSMALITAHVMNHSFCRSCVKCKARPKERQ